MSQPQVCMEFCRIYLLITPFPAANGIIKIRDLAVKEIKRLWTANQTLLLFTGAVFRKQRKRAAYRRVAEESLTVT